MIITAYFSNSGIPATGLSPIITIRLVSDGTAEVTDAAMTEIGSGFYKYDFTTYDELIEYVFLADGTDSLAGNDRYMNGSNELDTGVVLGNIRKIETNKWKISNDQFIVYDDDGTTVLHTYDLKDSAGDPSSSEVFERTPV